MKYDPAMCERIVALGRQGKSKVQIASELAIGRGTLYRWLDTIPEFREAMDDAMFFAQAYWENTAQNAVFDKDMNGNMITWQLMKRFPNEYQADKQKVELSGDPNGAPIKVEVNNAVEAAIAALRAHKEE